MIIVGLMAMPYIDTNKQGNGYYTIAQRKLVVGVSADALNMRKKGRAPVFSQDERLEIVAALKPVDAVFVEESLEQKRDYILEHQADILVMGDDWAGRFDEFGDICKVHYLPRTPAISTTALIEKISAGPV